MAGHSQFKNIMFRKGKQDKERSKLFAKLSREITVAAKAGLPDPAHNPRPAHRHHRRQGGVHAQGQYRARHRQGDAVATRENYDEIRYEGRGPGGVALIVETMTDNRNRTSADVRAAFSKYGGAMGETGSVSFMFDHVGIITYPVAKGSEDAMLEAALETGANECVSSAEAHEFLTSMEDFASVRDALEAQLGAPASAAIVWRPQNRWRWRTRPARP